MWLVFLVKLPEKVYKFLLILISINIMIALFRLKLTHCIKADLLYIDYTQTLLCQWLMLLIVTQR